MHRGRVYLAGAAVIGLVATTAVFVGRIAPLRQLIVHVLSPALLSLPVLLSVLGAGRLARRATERWGGIDASLGPLLTLAVDVAVGLPLFGTLCFVVALFDCSASSLSALTGVFAAFGLAALPGAAARLPLQPIAHRGSALCVALSVLGALMLAQLPPMTLDEVAYHMAVPKLWLQEGRVIELVLNSHSYFPFGIESAALPLLAWAGDLGARAFHFVILAEFVAGLGLVHGFLKQLGAGHSAALATAAVASTPALMLTGGVAWVDAPLLALTFALALALTSAQRAGFTRPSLARLVLVVAAGTLTKYTWALLLVVGFLGTWLSTGPNLRSGLRLALSGALGVALGGIYFVRNLIWVGNPVAPFLDRSMPAVTGFNAGGSAVDVFSNYLYDPSMVDESLGPALVALACALLLCQRALSGTAIARGLGLAACGGLLLLAGLGAAGRLLLPCLCLAGALGLFALERALLESPRALRLANGTSLLAAYLQLAFGMTAVAQYGPMTPASDSDAVIARRHRPLLEPTDRIDAALPPESLTLVLGIHESFGFGHRVRTAGNFDGPRIARYLEAESAAALHRKLRRDGFTHLAIYAQHLLVGSDQEHGRRAEVTTRIPATTSALLSELLQQHARAVLQGEGVMLFALAPAAPKP